MAKKTNKTSHVMELLTNGASTEVNEPVNGGGASTEAAASQEKKAEIQSRTVTPKKVTVVDKGSRDDRISQEILNNLTQELEKEAGGSSQEEGGMPSPQEEAVFSQEAAGTGAQAAPEEVSVASGPSAAPELSAVSESSAAPGLSAVSEPSATPGLSAAPEPEPDSQPLQDVPIDSVGSGPTAIQELKDEKNVSNGAAVKVSASGIVPESLVNSDLEDGTYRFVNVMELLLLRQNIPLLLDQHGVCNCERCMADVCALTLTGLPSKYVVTSKDSISPIVSYYETKFKIPLLTEFMKSCSKVRERPRHKK